MESTNAAFGKHSLDKNETSRFLGDGVCFKAKLIGILEVSEARGDRMCQEALSDLKIAIRAAGEHKQRITINVAIDGLRLRDEKTGDSLYHHPVHKISFIAQDMSDARAFGYIFGSPDTGHRFFGIKTDKAASQVVIAMRDLFQVVFALKKKEIELAKQNLDKGGRYSSSSMFSDSLPTTKTLKNTSVDTFKTNTDTKVGAAVSDGRPSPAVADLVDLELELNSLQQGLTQMERITPLEPFGSKDDPFGDSFISYTSNPLLPPPPSSGRDRTSRVSESSSIFSPKAHASSSIDNSSIGTDTFFQLNSADNVILSEMSAIAMSAGPGATCHSEFTFTEFNSSHEDPSSGGWFTPPADASSPTATAAAANGTHESISSDHAVDAQQDVSKSELTSQFDVFTELDPLGTGKSKPYVDKKHFFRDVKNPPKKVLNDLVSQNQPIDSILFSTTFNQTSTTTEPQLSASNETKSAKLSGDPFGDDPFDKTDPFAEADYNRQDPFQTEFASGFKFGTSGASRSPVDASMLQKQLVTNTKDTNLNKFKKLHEIPSLDLSSGSESAPEPPPRPPGSSLYASSASAATETAAYVPPPPLPPKKQAFGGDLARRSSPVRNTVFAGRPSDYDHIELYATGSILFAGENITRREGEGGNDSSAAPPLPLPARKTESSLTTATKLERPPSVVDSAADDDYLRPVGLPNIRISPRIARNTGPLLMPPPANPRKTQRTTSESASSTMSELMHPAEIADTETKPSVDSTELPPIETLDITLSQLTMTGLNELAAQLKIPTSQLSNMTLAQLTAFLSNCLKNGTQKTAPVIFSETFGTASDRSTTADGAKIDAETASFKADFAANFTESPITSSNVLYDRYAVFRELLEEGDNATTTIVTPPEAEVVSDSPSIQPAEEPSHFEDSFSSMMIGVQARQPITMVSNVLNSSSKISVQTTAGFALSTRRDIESTLNASQRQVVDKYAALRDIVNSDMEAILPINDDSGDANMINDQNAPVPSVEVSPDSLGRVDKACMHQVVGESIADSPTAVSPRNVFAKPEGNGQPTSHKDMNTRLIDSSPAIKTANIIKSPIPIAVTDLVQSNNSRLTSGSLSDVVSGSSPEVDNSASEAVKKTNSTTGESWAIFDRPNSQDEAVTEKNIVQSEEGISPWSSDSKEFGNGSPTEWRQQLDSESGGERCVRSTSGTSNYSASRGRNDREGHWNIPAEVAETFYPAGRRSVEHYEECYDCHDRPRRRRQPPWSQHGGGPGPLGTGSSGRDTLGPGPPPSMTGAPPVHSSSSRDASPWEDEPHRRSRGGPPSSGGSGGEGFERHAWSSRHARSQQSFERRTHSRRNTDSWDEDDDYDEYEDKHPNSSRYHYHVATERAERMRAVVVADDSERERYSSRDSEWSTNDWPSSEGRSKHRRSKRDVMERVEREARERWCCPDWEQPALGLTW